MTATETMVIIVCLVGGYWLVSYFIRDPEEMEFPLGTAADADAPEAPQDPPVDPPAQDRGFELPWSLVLGVSANASREQIVAAYKQKISQYHPDKVANMGEEIRDLAERRSKEINAAYHAALKVAG